MTTEGPSDATATKMIGLARSHLASSVGVVPEQIAIASVEVVQWRDAGLGCAKPGVDYMPMPRPGYIITLEVNGTSYEYHADQGTRVIQCRATQR
jgi:hypothetical protein